MKNALLCALVALIATSAVSHGLGPAKDTPSQAPTQADAVKTRPLPFHGTVTKVDPKAQTITVGKRVFHLNETTKLMMDNSAILLADVQVGVRVGGSYLKDENGNLHALKLNFKSAPEKSPDESPSKKPPGDESET